MTEGRSFRKSNRMRTESDLYGNKRTTNSEIIDGYFANEEFTVWFLILIKRFYCGVGCLHPNK